jgi:hypothetical protein
MELNNLESRVIPLASGFISVDDITTSRITIILLFHHDANC